MADMARRFLNEVQQHPTEGEVAPVGPAFYREFIEARCRRDDPATPIAGVAVALTQLFGLECGRVRNSQLGSTSQSTPTHGTRGVVDESAPPSTSLRPEPSGRAGRRGSGPTAGASGPVAPR